MRTEHSPRLENRVGQILRMTEATKMSSEGSDWTRLLTDPDLASHLGKLLQTYREVSPEQREAALLLAMREIKDAAVKGRQLQQLLQKEKVGQKEVPENVRENGIAGRGPVPPAELCRPEPVEETPPFAPDLFVSESDRRRFQRIKCYVAVEIRIQGQEAPVWGNLANVGRGGCLVETATVVPAGQTLEIGLWLGSGKIWVKGVIISGVVTRSSPSFGIRVKFSQSELSAKEHLREFLKFVETSARKSQSGKAYVAKLKA
jgi:hypothetical protein